MSTTGLASIPEHLKPSIQRYIMDRCEVDSETGCWNWLYSTNNKGYGTARVFGMKRAQSTVHRLSYLVSTGDIVDDLHVLHSCDNRLCCNPLHLRVGTNAENMNDRRLKANAAGVSYNKGRWKDPINANDGNVLALDRRK